MYVPSARTAGGAATMVMVAVADFVLSVTDVAFTMTELPVGIAAGAVKEVVGLLPGVVVGLKVPQAALPQVTDHVTPAAAASSLTTAVRFAGVLTTRFAGGLEMATEITGVP